MICPAIFCNCNFGLNLKHHFVLKFYMKKYYLNECFPFKNSYLHFVLSSIAI